MSSYKILKNSKNPNTINIMLSNLSNIPPCPGIKLEKSFVLYYLFIEENTKSPIWPNIVRINVTRTIPTIPTVGSITS